MAVETLKNDKSSTKHPNHETKFASLTIRSGLTISFTRNISLCLLRFFSSFCDQYWVF